MLVLDASVVLPACASPDGFDLFGSEELLAPPLMWSEARSGLHEALWRREVSAADAEEARRQLDGCPVRRRSLSRLGEEAWRIADELGWAKTYDAEYLGLAALLGCRLVTLDGRLLRGSRRLGIAISPDAL